jgi:hypothetical protein
VRSWSERGHTFYEVKMRKDEDWQPHQFLYLPGDNEIELRVLRVREGVATCRSSTTTAAGRTMSGASRHAIANRISP